MAEASGENLMSLPREFSLDKFSRAPEMTGMK